MNQIKGLILVAVCLLGMTFNAQANIQKTLTNICDIVKSDDKSALRKKMKIVHSNYSMRIDEYYSGIKCSGDSLIRTAMLNNSVEAGTLLIRKMPKGALRSAAKDGKTLPQWAAEKGLANNHLLNVYAKRVD